MLSERGEPAAALLSIVASAVVALVLMTLHGIDSVVPIYGGLAVSVVSFAGLSLALRHRRRLAPAAGNP